MHYVGFLFTKKQNTLLDCYFQKVIQLNKNSFNELFRVKLNYLPLTRNVDSGEKVR